MRTSVQPSKRPQRYLTGFLLDRLAEHFPEAHVYFDRDIAPCLKKTDKVYFSNDSMRFLDDSGAMCWTLTEVALTCFVLDIQVHGELEEPWWEWNQSRQRWLPDPKNGSKRKSRRPSCT